MIALTFEDAWIAWKGINRKFILGDDRVVDLGSCTKYLLVGYDAVIHINHPHFKDDYEVDFGKLFFYTKSKWSHLIGNYIDYTALEILRGKIRQCIKDKKKFKDISYQFKNHYKNGKGCLLSLVISKRPTGFHLAIFLRSSEITKRLLVDFLLFERIGEWLLRDRPFSYTVHINNLFNECAVLAMYNQVERLRKIGREIKESPHYNKEIYKKVIAEYRNIAKHKKVESIKYKIHKRAWRCLKERNGIEYPKLGVSECTL
jgi:ribosomal protein L21